MTNPVVLDGKNHQITDIESKKDLVKRLFCKNCTDDEMQLFIHACKRTGLDPFMKQIYCIKRGQGEKAKMTIQTGIDGLRLIAERTGNYSPGRESVFNCDEKGTIISATSYIKKRTSDGTWHEVAAVAYMQEYDEKQNLWLKMPRAMLSKCAEALALRKAFPAEMSGLYTTEEMAQASPEIPKERTEISEEEWAGLDVLVQQIKDKEYFDKLASHVEIPTIWDLKPKDFDRVMRSIRKKANQKGEIDEQKAMA